MAVYEDSRGVFSIKVHAEPNHIYARLFDDEMPNGMVLSPSDLYDLRHLVDMAIKAVQNEEAKG